MLNSAPVQLLPIDNGSGYKKTSEIDKQTEPKERFDNVFDSVTKKEKSDFPKEVVKEVSREKSSGKQKTETEVSKKLKKQKSKHTEDEDVIAASTQHEMKGESKLKAEKLHIGLAPDGLSKEDLAIKTAISKDAKGLKLVEAVKKKVSSVKKEAVKGGIKSAGETVFAGNGLLKVVSGKTTESKKTVLTKSGKVSGKNSKDVDFIKNLTHGKTVEKPSIQLVSSAAQSIKHSIGTSDSKKSGLNSEKKTSKLRVVDHRQFQSVDSGKGVKTEPSLESGSFKSAVEAAERDVELNPSTDSLKTELRTAETKTVQSSVLTQLKDTVNNQIVKQAGIIVKGNGTGEIKLVMKPESLGKVRIQLSLNDNHIAGRIIVENNIVREIFESNLENLYRAFGSEGFENGGLEVSVQGQGGEADGNGRRSRKGFNGRAVKVIEDAVPELVSAEWQNNAVNMVV